MVSQIAKEQDAYSQAFKELREKVGTVSPSWVNRLREDAFERFEEQGFPTTRQEEWKYTNVAAVAKANFEPAVARQENALAVDAAELNEFVYEEARHSRLVFVNGFYRAELSSLEALPEGVIALDLAEALNSDANVDVVREQLARSAAYDENAFTALNTAFFAGGALLRIPQGVRVEAPVHLLFLSDGRAALTASFPRTLVIAERDSSATFIESYAGIGEGSGYLTSAVTEIVLAEGARLEHYKVQRESTDAFHVAATAIKMGRNSSYDSTTVTLGAQLSRHDIKVALDGEGAEAWIDGLYIVGDNQHADTHSLIDHREPHCSSHQLYKGILDGKSRAVFNGKVFVREGAQQTDARQTNRNLLLSNEARVDTKPQLEIFADDVKCAHGATVGQLEEEELFYLASRGLHPELARNLLTYGFAEEVIDKIKIESIKAQLGETVLNRLHARLEA
jgi:Fe-S cluster assembly protein SufD